MSQSPDKLLQSTADNNSNTTEISHYLGFDFGEKRIGIAIGQSGTLSASPLRVVKNINGRPEWDEITALISEWKPAALILSLIHI